MKKITLLLAGFSLSFTSFSQTVITDTVSTGPGYTNQVWYSLENDEQGSQSKDNWDLGFEITGYTASIIANTQKSNFLVYKAPFSIANYGTLDTSGIAGWPIVFNSDTSWSIGALNKGITTDPNDLGWGVYDMSTHFINGDSTFVIKLSATSYKKFKIDNLGSGVYNFTYANIDGSSPQTIALQKSTYTGKNFGYFNMTTNLEVDREPLTANWDITFTKYTGFIPSPYGLTGVLSNKGVKVAQANNVASPETYNNFSAHTFGTEINEIGYDWKYFNMTSFVYEIAGDSCYFVKTVSGDIWKLRMTGFGGSANGNYIFTKEYLATVGIEDLNGNTISQFSLYPNPVSTDDLTILFSSEKEISNVNLQLMDISGKIISSETVNLTEGFNQYKRSVNELNSGLYFVQISTPEFRTVQKFVKH